MSWDSTRQQGQAMAESLMPDLCVITRVNPSATKTLNTTTGAYVEPAPLTIYDGVVPGTGAKCWISDTGLGAGSGLGKKVVEAGQNVISLWPFIISVPLSALGLRVDDIVSIVSSVDADLIGAQLRVREVGMGSQSVARRLGCERNAG